MSWVYSNPNRHTVAEQRERQPARPAKGRDLLKKGPTKVVEQHTDDRNQLEQVGVQIGFQFG